MDTTEVADQLQEPPTRRRAPLVVRIELPTPDIVVVQGAAPGVLLFADVRVPEADVAAAIDNLDAILAGPGYPLHLVG